LDERDEMLNYVNSFSQTTNKKSLDERDKNGNPEFFLSNKKSLDEREMKMEILNSFSQTTNKKSLDEREMKYFN